MLTNAPRDASYTNTIPANSAQTAQPRIGTLRPSAADAESCQRVAKRLRHKRGRHLDQDANALEERLRGLSTVQLEQPIGIYGYSNVGYQILIDEHFFAAMQIAPLLPVESVRAGN
jgi:hypothetical protein